MLHQGEDRGLTVTHDYYRGRVSPKSVNVGVLLCGDTLLETYDISTAKPLWLRPIASKEKPKHTHAEHDKTRRNAILPYMAFGRTYD